MNAGNFSVSPDEEQIAFVTFENEKYIVWTMPLQRDGSPKQIVGLTDEVRNTVWHSDGRRILYSALTNGVFQIYSADLSAAPVQITFGDKDALALDVSNDGARILYGSSKEESDVWGANVEKAEEFVFASDIDSELWANVAPDSKTVAYQSVKNLSQGDKIFSGAILTKSKDSDAPPFQLVAGGSIPTWSPDGKRLVFVRVTGETYNLWTIKSAGGEEKQLTTDGLPSIEFSVLPYNRTQASNFSWSPDSRKIAYVSKSGGQQNIRLVDSDNLENFQLTGNTDSNVSVYCPLWSSDGKRLAYSAKGIESAADKRKFYSFFVADTETKNSKLVFQTENFQRLLGWSAADKDLILASISNKSETGSPTEVKILQVNVETGEQHELAKLESTYLYNIYLSADKKVLAYVSNKDGKDNIWVMRFNGSKPQKITSNNDARLYFSTLSWSPDNQFIYFGKQARYSLLWMITNFK